MRGALMPGVSLRLPPAQAREPRDLRELVVVGVLPVLLALDFLLLLDLLLAEPDVRHVLGRRARRAVGVHDCLVPLLDVGARGPQLALVLVNLRSLYRHVD